MKFLKDKVAIVAGGSRGAGRGIAHALGDAGATVYVAARTSRNGPPPADGAPGTVEDTAEEVTARGGRGIAIRADLSKPEQVEALFARVQNKHRRVDVVVNAAWGANVIEVWARPYWDLDPRLWQGTLDTVSVCWFTSVYASRLMTKQGHGLIVHVTDNSPDDTSAHRGQILHDIGHECINRLIMGMSKKAKKSKVAVVGLNPGFMRTERVLAHMSTEALKKQFRFDLSESPEYIGRAVAALAADPEVLRKNGQLLWVSDLAKEYGFTDIDGRYIPRFDPKAPQQDYPCIQVQTAG